MGRDVVLLASLLAVLFAITAAALPLTPARAEERPAGLTQKEAERNAQRGRYRRARRAQTRLRAKWHRRAPRSRVRRWLAQDPPPLVLRPVKRPQPYELVPMPGGSFDADQLSKAREAFATREGAAHDVHPRLLELMYRAARHFRAPYVYVVSGYREGRSTSRHSHGRAVDLVLPGVPDRRLASYLSRQGFVGVGLYTRSRFVHLDVRHRSYFWMDHSRPGSRSQPRPVFRKRAARADARASRRGETQVEPLEGASLREEGG